MNEHVKFDSYFYKNVLLHFQPYLTLENSCISKLLYNIFYSTFFLKKLITSSLFSELFSYLKQLPNNAQVLFRQEYVRYTYFPICYENIVFLKNTLINLKKGKMIEIAAGNGWTTYFLQKYGINCKCFDDFSWEKLMETEKPVEVIKSDAIEAIEKEQPDIVLSIWPPPTQDFLEKVYQTLPEDSTLLIVHDTDENVRGNKNFFKNNTPLTTKKLPYSFAGFNDMLSIFVK